MKTLRTLLLTVMLGPCLAATAANPASDPPRILTLEEALAIAENGHPEIAEAQALVRAAEGRVQQAGVRPNPEAIVRLENAPLDGHFTRDADYLAGVGVTLPLGERRSKAVRVEDLDRRRLGFEAEGRKLELRRRVQGAFAQALYQEQARQVRGELVSASEQASRITRSRVELGDAVSADLARVEVELAAAQAEWRRSDLLHRQSLLGLAAAIGLPPDAVGGVQGSLNTAFEVPALEELAAHLADHPTLAAASADVSARSASVEWSKAIRIPDLRAEVLYRRIESERRDALDVGLSLPLPLFDRSRGRQVEAENQRDAAEARLRSVRSQLHTSVQEAHTLLTAALAEARTLEQDIVPRMESVRLSTEARYAAGDLALTDALLVRRDHAAVRLRHLEALRDAMLAWNQLRQFVHP